MEHFDLEDMFGRRQKPRLSIHLKHLLSPNPNENTHHHELLQFNIENTGRATARYVGFFVKLENVNIIGVSGNHNLRDVSHLNDGSAMISYTDNIDVVHPNNISIFVGQVRFQRSNPVENILVELSSYCENARAETRRPIP
jgi:hypothetical protein